MGLACDVGRGILSRAVNWFRIFWLCSSQPSKHFWHSEATCWLLWKDPVRWSVSHCWQPFHQAVWEAKPVSAQDVRCNETNVPLQSPAVSLPPEASQMQGHRGHPFPATLQLLEGPDSPLAPRSLWIIMCCTARCHKLQVQIGHWHVFVGQRLLCSLQRSSKTLVRPEVEGEQRRQGCAMGQPLRQTEPSAQQPLQHALLVKQDMC